MIDTIKLEPKGEHSSEFTERFKAYIKREKNIGISKPVRTITRPYSNKLAEIVYNMAIGATLVTLYKDSGDIYKLQLTGDDGLRERAQSELERATGVRLEVSG